MHKFSFFSDSPYCGFDEPQVVGVALMEQQELPCDVVSNPKRLVFHWSFNGSADGTPLTSFTTNGSRYIFRPFIDEWLRKLFWFLTYFRLVIKILFWNMDLLSKSYLVEKIDSFCKMWKNYNFELKWYKRLILPRKFISRKQLGFLTRIMRGSLNLKVLCKIVL